MVHRKCRRSSNYNAVKSIISSSFEDDKAIIKENSRLVAVSIVLSLFISISAYFMSEQYKLPLIMAVFGISFIVLLMIFYRFNDSLSKAYEKKKLEEDE